MITAAQLLKIMPNAGTRAALYAPHLANAMVEFHIDSPARQAAFLAQVAHESGELRYVRELASGAAYEGRKDLGNTQPGDGPRFRGRGLIQITGRANYRDCSRALFDIESILLNEPERLELPGEACRSAAWFWWSRVFNPLADAGKFREITRRINGGYNGLADRERYWARAKTVLGVA
ncbi:MAG: glycoside hydrolase family 19 protein [Hydrogenophilales bacterium]|nr:glycoside hydrolase family 19 protein [Hydrogenophilales bacterium]